MSDDLPGLIAVGLENVKLATSLDGVGMYQEALDHYLKGIEVFMQVLRLETNPVAGDALSQKLSQYLHRAEVLKSHLGASSPKPATIHPTTQVSKPAPSPASSPTTTTITSSSTSSSHLSFQPSLIELPPSLPPSPHPNLHFDVSHIPLRPTSSASSAADPQPPPHVDGGAPDPSKSAASLVKSIRISHGELGHTYESLFGEYARQAEQVTLADPYFRERHQFFNLIRFSEMLVRAKTPRIFTVITKMENELQQQAFSEFMTELATSLFDFQITLRFAFDEHLHDREIHFDHAFIAHLGRGIDIYQKPSSRFCVGLNDYSLRACQQSTIDIFQLVPISSS
ncbi:MAG: MIT C-terminal domain-containing protein [archaeon]|nr:MIT C-terminal domain-containing protein [archaeon]